MQNEGEYCQKHKQYFFPFEQECYFCSIEREEIVYHKTKSNGKYWKGIS